MEKTTKKAIISLTTAMKCMEELTCNISVNTEPDWDSEISELKKKINLIEEDKMVLQKRQAELLEHYCF